MEMLDSSEHFINFGNLSFVALCDKCGIIHCCKKRFNYQKCLELFKFHENSEYTRISKIAEKFG